MKRITVFCGSSFGNGNTYRAIATDLGKYIATKGIGLVYGGAGVGLMGSVADGVLAEGGEVIGVLPEFLGSKEIAHDGLTQLITVKTMHERKSTMEQLSDGVIALPGGFGTIEEMFEMLTWAQLALHKKPVAILNINNFFDILFKFIDHMVNEGFLKQFYNDMLIRSNSIPDVIEKMEKYTPPPKPKWLFNEKQASKKNFS